MLSSTNDSLTASGQRAGTFGWCYRAVRKSDGMQVAIKSLMRDSAKFNAAAVKHEIKVKRTSACGP